MSRRHPAGDLSAVDYQDVAGLRVSRSETVRFITVAVEQALVGKFLVTAVQVVGDHEEIQSVQDGLIHPGGRPDIAVGENGVSVHVALEGQVALDVRNYDPVGHYLG